MSPALGVPPTTKVTPHQSSKSLQRSAHGAQLEYREKRSRFSVGLCHQVVRERHLLGGKEKSETPFLVIETFLLSRHSTPSRRPSGKNGKLSAILSTKSTFFRPTNQQL
eukprot:Selendium_serpulae@DN6695_c0_g1_i1.p1